MDYPVEGFFFLEVKLCHLVVANTSNRRNKVKGKERNSNQLIQLKG